MFSPLINELIDSLKALPGVGPRSAQRMAFYLLNKNRPAASRIAKAMTAAAEQVGKCRSCRNLTEEAQCRICADARRDHDTVCVVETPADVLAFEQSATYNGRYFVLFGHLSPIDGVGPKDLGIPLLEEQMHSGLIKELILATNPSLEGETTAFYISDKAHQLAVKVSKIAQGVPLGGDLEMIDGSTLAHALSRRQAVVPDAR